MSPCFLPKNAPYRTRWLGGLRLAKLKVIVLPLWRCTYYSSQARCRIIGSHSEKLDLGQMIILRTDVALLFADMRVYAGDKLRGLTLVQQTIASPHWLSWVSATWIQRAMAHTSVVYAVNMVIFESNCYTFWSTEGVSRTIWEQPSDAQDMTVNIYTLTIAIFIGGLFQVGSSPIVNSFTVKYPLKL